MMKKQIVSLMACGLVAFPLIANSQSANELTEKYSGLAGSAENAEILVSGLRDGSAFTLDGTSFDPPTGTMGYGNVNIALALAEKNLADQGITDPTAAQLESALVGTQDVPGILQMRADGMGWGEIAHSVGLKLGEVMRSPRAAERVTAGTTKPEAPARAARAQRPQIAHGARVERPVMPIRPEKPERPVKPERPERPGR